MCRAIICYSTILLLLFLNFCFIFPANGLFQSKMHPINLDKHQRKFMQRFRAFSAFGNKINRKAQLYDYADRAYFIMVTIGSDNQALRVIPDTGSPVFWVTDSNCTSTVCQQRHRFRQNSSRSYQPTNIEFNLQYGTGSVIGRYGKDTVGIGQPPIFRVPDSLFGQAYEMDRFFSQIPEMDGICGLSPYAYGGVHSPVLSAFQKKLLPQQLFTVFMKPEGTNSRGTQGGTITWGEIDDVNCEKEVHYVPLVARELDTHWTFKIEGLSYGNYRSDRVKRAVTDSGTSHLIGPAEEVDKLRNAIGIDLISDESTVPCEKVRGPIILKIGGKEFPIPKELFMQKSDFDESKCVPLIMKHPRGDGHDFWILGIPFIHRYCQVHDLGNKQVGFAAVKNTKFVKLMGEGMEENFVN